MKTIHPILTPALLLKKLSTLPSGTGLTAKETLQWLQRFSASEKRRVQFKKTTGIPAPGAVIFSPTMQCNYTCTGCYSRTHPSDDELSTERMDAFFRELQEVGTSVCLISGGEPFLRTDLPSLMLQHPELLFIVFTNGSQITAPLARQLRESRNVIPTLSIEGTDETVNQRRGEGASLHLHQAIKHLKAANLFFGFSTMVTQKTLPQILAENFFAKRAEQGYRIGFIMEYIPVGKDIDLTQILTQEKRQQLRNTVVNAQKKDPILLYQLPDDTDDGTSCGAAGRFMHINSSGGLEPCPFAHHSDTSIRDQTFQQALQSPFFQRIRETPDLFEKKKINCSLVENDALLKTLLES
jgi:MoaA/NifB/PqqE/SkfB family radical SAM enzyme